MTPSDSPTFRILMQQLQARHEWEAANPLLAAEWSEAKLLDSQWERQRELNAARQRAELDATFLLKKLGVPERAARTLEGADFGKPPLARTRRWLLEQGKPFLFLMGGNGTGKTVAAAFAVKEALLASAGVSRPSGGRAWQPARWVEAGELACLSSFDDADREFLEDCQRTRLLVLEEFASENLHREALARLERLINHRYGNNLRTVFTSNISSGQLNAPEWARIRDRLHEVAVVFECGNESLRKRT